MEAIKKKAGRPKVDQNDKKTAYSVSLTPKQYNLLTAKFNSLTQAILTLV